MISMSRQRLCGIAIRVTVCLPPSDNDHPPEILTTAGRRDGRRTLFESHATTRCLGVKSSQPSRLAPPAPIHSTAVVRSLAGGNDNAGCSDSVHPRTRLLNRLHEQDEAIRRPAAIAYRPAMG